MCFNKKKKAMLLASTEQNDTVQASLKKIKVLQVKYEGKTEVTDLLTEIYNQYSNAHLEGTESQIKSDKGIANALDDIELCAKKSEKTNDYTEILGLIKNIKILLAER